MTQLKCKSVTDFRDFTLPELLAPAGSFGSAIAAFEGGADAVYVGLPEFSARKQARNVSREEYRRLRRYALERGKCVYVALNTVLREREISKAMETVTFLWRQGVDAVIVQDLGLMALINKRFPGLRLHVSTQAAVQTAEAALVAAEMGIKRIILPRETGIEAMRDIIALCPGIEFECFVHGALCYSFSGVCLASGVLFGRSGNRGECAQPCRSWYDLDSRGRAYWFSCNDLDLSSRVGDLAKAGVTALKIEGRMKSPEYSYAVSRLYRAILDALARGEEPDQGEIRELRNSAQIAFGRDVTEGYFRSESGENLLGPKFPGHRGVKLGVVASSSGSRLLMRLLLPLSERDGILVVPADDTKEPYAFPVRSLRNEKTGQEIRNARSGSDVSFEFDGHTARGDEIRLISSRNADLREINPRAYPTQAPGISLDFSTVAKGKEAAHAIIPLPDGTQRSISVPLPALATTERAKKPGAFVEALKVFMERGEHTFTLNPTGVDRARVAVGSQAANDEISLADAFIPPSILKRARNEAYTIVENALTDLDHEYADQALCDPPVNDIPATDERMPLPERSALVYDIGLYSAFPFATLGALDASINDHPHTDQAVFVPLALVVADTRKYFQAAFALVERFLASGDSRRLIFGINGLHHVAFIRRVRNERIGSFIDMYAYAANASAAAVWSSLLRGADFGYYYIEAGNEGLGELKSRLDEWEMGGFRIIPVDNAFIPPLFLSKGCFRKHHDGACGSDCTRHFSYTLRRSGRGFTVLVIDCITYTFLLKKCKK